MITFLVGKIPGAVKQIIFEGDVLTVSEAVKMGAEECGFVYAAFDVVYLNGEVVSNDALVNNENVVLVDIPKIRGNQMTVKIGRHNSVLSHVALHDDDTVRTAIEVAGIPSLSDGEVVCINGEISTINGVLDDGDIVVIKLKDSISRNIDIYEAIAAIRKDIEEIKTKIGIPDAFSL